MGEGIQISLFFFISGCHFDQQRKTTFRYSVSKYTMIYASISYSAVNCYVDQNALIHRLICAIVVRTSFSQDTAPLIWFKCDTFPIKVYTFLNIHCFKLFEHILLSRYYYHSKWQSTTDVAVHICLSQNFELRIETWPQCYLRYVKFIFRGYSHQVAIFIHI